MARIVLVHGAFAGGWCWEPVLEPLREAGHDVQTLDLPGSGADDTPPSEAEQYYQALQLRGVPTALVRVPGASHGGLAARPSQSAAKAAAILAWFERYKPASQ